MEKWKELLEHSVTDIKGLKKRLGINEKQLGKVTKKYPMRISPYYLSLIKTPGDPIWKQTVPNPNEINDRRGQADPLHEKSHSPVPGLIHRYPDRILVYASNVCATYCRFCTRKRKVGKRYTTLCDKDFKTAMRYIKNHKQIRDVIISGGDPLLNDDKTIEKYLKAISQIDHVEIIRIDSRVPCTLPQRITPKLIKILKKYDPIYLLTHFNHPREITKAAKKACALLAEAGVVLGNQSVLLKGVNDSAKTLKKLGQELLKIRVRPYYIYIADAVQGTYHFRVPIKKAIKIMRALIGHTSGLAIPKLIIDLENGGGKTPLCPNYVKSKKGKLYSFKNFEDKIYQYHDV